MTKIMGVVQWLWLMGLLCLAACGGSYSSGAAEAKKYEPSRASYAMDAPMEPEADDYGGGDEDMLADDMDADGAMLAQLSTDEYRGEMAGPGAAPPPPPAPKSKLKSVGKPPEELKTATGPMLIYTAEFTLAIFEVDEGLKAVEKIARDLGGFLARRDDTSITVRIPVAEFDRAVKRVESVGDVLHRNVMSEDVTEEFRDLGIQLANLRAMRDRLAKLLDRAETVEDALKVERELGRVAGQIDRIEGRMKFLKDRAAMSTLTVSFQELPTDLSGPGEVRLPIGWLSELGLGRLLSL